MSCKRHDRTRPLAYAPHLFYIRKESDRLNVSATESTFSSFGPRIKECSSRDHSHPFDEHRGVPFFVQRLPFQPSSCLECFFPLPRTFTPHFFTGRPNRSIFASPNVSFPSPKTSVGFLGVKRCDCLYPLTDLLKPIFLGPQAVREAEAWVLREVPMLESLWRCSGGKGLPI